MQRILEPELMEDAAQVNAYAKADFEQPHNDFIQRLQALVANPGFDGNALDLGCGPGDITCRFAKAFPLCSIDAVDGSETMLEYARAAIKPELERVNFIHCKLPCVLLPQLSYDIIYSNSLLHHLPEPRILWQVIQQYDEPGTFIAVMDLIRPDNEDMAKKLVEMYAGNEPEILQKDFYNSLLAAFTLDEIKDQLTEANLPLAVEQISDRHVFISGKM